MLKQKNTEKVEAKDKAPYNFDRNAWFTDKMNIRKDWQMVGMYLRNIVGDQGENDGSICEREG